ncbi:hypothetical protein BO94DRAFT_244919 [Aspergillus sclerotioniger CBS 115572]|uniref:CAP-Gly domain-containing protein n=1 Tax=Aspergillus sclerotioniger CBS 115572 TaxID=1450535 RepID=A0A317VG96_9EURO|nr:hypothetical protein BO94DRAFT_244919 [Aspergillus sclerotioniger CBS 115572]PWY72459.1 hypothetical protein BO94DRAFT_244919 [Aspergillus sclerotioniger CBS 115572]
MAPLDDVQVGDLVNVPGGMYGTVKYLGGVAGKPGKFAGIELASEHARRGKNNGDVEGRKYFSTSVPGSGIFVPMNNNKYVTKRMSGPSSMGSGGPPTPSRPINFSKSVGPGPAMRPPRVRRPSLPRPESPRGPPPSKMTLTGLRTPSAAASRAAPSSSYPRSPIKAPSRASDRPPSRVSRVSTEDDIPSTRTSEVRRSSMEGEVQDLKDHIKSLETQLLDRDRQLDEQAATLSDFQRTLEELEGSDSLSIRAQLRERNERIAQLTAEFDLHRADFRSTLDTLEVAASETERVYEQRLDELMQQNKELQDRGEDVEAVARQLKQLEELVSELEEGLEDARRGEAEARAEVEFLRGEVERTKLELQKERDTKDIHTTGDAPYHSKELEQKDDEIRGLKAIIHSLSRGDPDLHALQQGGFATTAPDHDPEHIAHLEQRVEEYERLTERKAYRIEELERELQQLQLNGDTHTHTSSRITPSPNSHKAPSSNGKLTNGGGIGHAHRLSDRTVVPSDWQDSPPHDGQYQAYSTRHRGVSDASHHRLETMHESDGRSEDGGSLWCEICETGGHDILTCTNMFGAESKNKASDDVEPAHDDSSIDEKQTPEASTDEPSTSSHLDENTPLRKTGHDAVLEGLKGHSVPPSMGSVAGKESGVVDESKWCALCERDGHDSIDCPFDD